MHSEALAIEFIEQLKGISVEDDVEFNFLNWEVPDISKTQQRI